MQNFSGTLTTDNNSRAISNQLCTYGLLPALLVLAAVYRLTNLDFVSMWADELWGVLASSQGSWQAMIDNLIQHDSHPPGYQTFLYHWMTLFGKTDFIIRLPSALVGIAAVMAIYNTGKHHFSPTTGIVAAAILTGHFQAVYYSQEARAYSMLILVTAWHYGYLLSVLYGSTNNRDKAGFVITATVLLYLHYAGAVVFFSEAILFLVMWLRNPTRTFLLQGVTVFALPLLLYAPWIPSMYKHATSITNYWTEKPSLASVESLLHFLMGKNRVLFNLTASTLIAGLSVLSYKTITGKQQAADSKAWLLLWLAVTSVSIFFAKSIFSQSIHTDRHFLYVLPLLCLLCAHSLSMLAACFTRNSQWQTRIMVVCMIGIVALQHSKNNHRFYNPMSKQNLRGAVDLLTHDSEFMAGDRLVVASNEFFDHYLQQKAVTEHARVFLWDFLKPETLESIDSANTHQVFYFLNIQTSTNQGADSFPQAVLDQRYARLCLTQLHRVWVSKYSRTPGTGGTPSTKDCRDP